MDIKYLDALTSMHRELFEGNNLYGKLIYFDNNFKSYFSKILTITEYQLDNFIFGIFVNKSLSGFIHLKDINNTLFLNNIFITKNQRGKGFGKSTLLSAVDIVKKTKHNNFDFFELEVFKSNINAYIFYQSIGLKKTLAYNWYLIIGTNNDLNSCKFIIEYDINNFKGIYLNDNKVGTIVNDEFIVVHNSIAFKYDSKMFFVYKTSSENNELPENYKLIESSIRMSLPFSSFDIK